MDASIRHTIFSALSAQLYNFERDLSLASSIDADTSFASSRIEAINLAIDSLFEVES